MLVLGVGSAILGLSVLILLAQGVRRLCLLRIGGYTGACLGAVQQVGELGFYLGAAFML
jgi:adenosylcobinamide-GDP ribazoletransferase